MRGLKSDLVWNERVLAFSFWSLNIGLALMALLTLLPLGTLQLLAAKDHVYCYALSAEFMQQPVVDTLVWFVASLWLRPKREWESRS